MIPPLPDRDDRRLATTEFGRNLVVEAGAGTGKTSLLVERLLVAFGRGLLRPGEFAAITFTEKAAAELRERLAEGLETLVRTSRGDADPDESEAAGRAHRHLVQEAHVPSDDIAGRSLEALGGLDRAAVGTIHAFCADLLRSHPLEAGVDPRFRVDEGPLFDALLDRSWEEYLSRELGPLATRRDLWGDVLRASGLEAVTLIAKELARFRIPEPLLRSPGEPPVAAARRIGARLRASIEDVLRRQSGLSPKPREFLDALGRALDELDRGGLDGLRSQAAAEGEILKGSPPAPNPKLAGIPREEYLRVARAARRLVRALADSDDALADRIVEAVAPFALDSRAALLRSGAVGFDGLLTLARDLLRDHPGVRERLRHRFRMLLVDEFQDTDPVQYEILLFLGGVEGEREADAFRVPLAPGRLFIVGDPKQSIYRFRGADYAAFRRAVDRVLAEGGAHLHLTVNFRSTRPVLEAVNLLFGAGWGDEPYQPPYVAVSATAARRTGPRVEVWTVPPARRAPESRLAEGRAVAAGIRRLVDEGASSFRDVLVLLRAFTGLAPYLRALREAGIPFVVDGGKEFLERPEVAHLMAVLRALARPSDPVALLAYLRSPTGGVPDTELAAHAAEGGTWSRDAAVGASNAPALASALARLNGLAEEIRSLPADAAIRHVHAETRLEILGAFAFEGAQRVANLRMLAATGAELARDGRLSLNEVLDALEGERAGDLVEGDSPLADERTDAVRVMTIHKAKGLEAPVVFVADLARAEPTGSSPRGSAAVLATTGEEATLAVSAGGIANSASAILRHETERHERAEELRVLYVALTRARERLVVIARRPSRAAAWIDALVRWGYDAAHPPPDGADLAQGLALHRAVDPGRAAGEARVEAPEDTGPAVDAYRAAVERVARRSGPAFWTPSRGSDSDRGGNVRGPREEGAESVPRIAGAAIHRLLEEWDRRSERWLRENLPRVARAAAANEDADPAPVIREVSSILDAFLASDLPRRLASVEVLGREIPFLQGTTEGPVWRGAIDLLYRDEAGALVVADYKTDRDFESALERHGAQLRAYADAVRRALALDAPPKAELWLLRAGRRERVPAGFAAGEEGPP